MKLIINADDFGLSKSISDGIIVGIKDGYITSTSVMSNMTWAEYAIKEAIKNDIKCIGLHVNLTVGKPIIENSNLVDDDGTFLYNRKQIDNKKLMYEDAYNEIMAQIEMVTKYSDGKISIDHLDTHHHLFDNSCIKQAVLDISKKLDIPIRKDDSCDVKCPDVLFKDFTIKNVNVDSIKTLVFNYKEKDVVVELMTHPGFIDEYTETVTSYLDREKELDVLKECKLLGLFDGIELISFSDF
jgi:predicted glycoside hydrolase/deacetylase ChbG (UPF0249 family)